MQVQITKLILTMIIALAAIPATQAQEQKRLVRLARLEIDPAHLEEYKVFLKEGIEASLTLEPGVITLYAMQEKDNPTHFTILETYADENAYQSHIKTPHFLKYKNGTLHMVKSLELADTTPLLPESTLTMKIMPDK